MTATFNEAELKIFTNELFNSFDQIYFVNAGNQQIKTMPTKKYFYGKNKRSLFYRRLWGNLNNGKTKILFCKKRSEVDWWRQKLKKEKTSALFCLGGAVGEFQEALKNCPKPEIIICTSALSHGVNLPEIQEVYLGYHIANIDFYWQMVGRAGRRGEKFVLHTFNCEQFNRQQRILSFFDHLFFDILGDLLCKQKWKEFYSPRLPIRSAILLLKFCFAPAKKFRWFFTADAVAAKN
jgi:superfamily II DNA helicase RecQ